MKILGIDTSTKNLSVAILDEDRLLAEFNGRDRLRHSQDLIPRIASLLKSARLALSDLDGFAVSIGPGSFTGLRIGVTTLKGLNLVTGKPIAAVPTLDALAYNISGEYKNICVIVDAKKNKVYACIYTKIDDKIKRETEYLLLPIEELLERIDSPAIFLGDGIGLYKEAISNKLNSAQFAEENLWFPKASIVSKLGIEKLRKDEITGGDELVPMYLYSRECSIRGIDR